MTNFPTKAFGWFLLLCILVASYFFMAGFVTVKNREVPTQYKPKASPASSISSPLNVLVWNIGYAGLGEESDFVADGGEMLLPPDRHAIVKNLDGILKTLQNSEFDVALMQEVAEAGFLTRGVEVLGGIAEGLSDHSLFFSSDISTKWFPQRISLKHGLAIFSKDMKTPPQVIRIDEEPERIMGFIKRKYHIQEMELVIDNQDWAIINIHLSAFDKSASVRTKQLETVFKIANEHYQAGKAVVVGGDWNMRLGQTDFPYTSSEEALFWIHDFPQGAINDGWQKVFDPSGPTVRTNERPFNKGENYTTIIDGLVISPNVSLLDAQLINLDFKYTDHQPTIFKLEKN